MALKEGHMPALNGLSLKQKRFTREYVKNNGNATKAALEAYDTSYDSAQNIGSVNMDKPAIINEINRLLSQEHLNDDEWLAKNIKQSIESGIGIKATNKDAITMINMLLKAKNAYPGTKNSSVKLTLKGNLTSENVDAVITKLKGMGTRSNELIEDIS